MLDLRLSTKFKKDYARCRKRQYDMGILQSVVDVLRIPAPLPPMYKDHPLGGDWIGRRECHIKGDWLLIYHVVGNELQLDRTGYNEPINSDKKIVVSKLDFSYHKAITKGV